MTNAFARAHRKDRANLPVLDGLTLTGTLGDRRGAERWKARDQHREPWTAYRVHAPRALTAAQLRARVLPLADVRHGHILPISRFTTDDRGRLWIVSPYPGNHDGLVSLASLLPMKDGGQMSPDEAERATLHTLEALHHLHARNIHHGSFRIDELLVDRHGSVLVELPGVIRRVNGVNAAGREVVRDEIHSIALIAYQLITGLEPGVPRIPVARLVRKLAPAWADWIETALDESRGFDDVGQAIKALPSRGDLTPTPRTHTDPAPEVRSRAVRLIRRLPGVFRP